MHQVETEEVVQVHYSTPVSNSSPSKMHSPAREQSKQRGPRSSEWDGGNAQKDRNSLNFLSQPLSFLWRRLKWSVILSLGRNDSLVHLNKEDMKTAVSTQLEVAIMGSALVLTLCLQMQEVVGSRGGFTLPERDRARFVFVSSSALSFSFAFYSIITSAMMLLSINAVPRRYVFGSQPGASCVRDRSLLSPLLHCLVNRTNAPPSNVIASRICSRSAERFFTGLSSWSAIPRLCTLTGAFCLGVAAMSAFFLGLEDTTAWVGVAVTAIALLLTVLSTVFIFIRVRRLQTDVLEEGQECASTSNTDCRIDIDPEGSPTRKFPDLSGPNQGSSSFQPVLTPLSSLTNTTGFSLRTSRYHH